MFDILVGFALRMLFRRTCQLIENEMIAVDRLAFLEDGWMMRLLDGCVLEFLFIKIQIPSV